jgi:hypothetical protein
VVLVNDLGLSRLSICAGSPTVVLAYETGLFDSC